MWDVFVPAVQSRPLVSFHQYPILIFHLIATLHKPSNWDCCQLQHFSPPPTCTGITTYIQMTHLYLRQTGACCNRIPSHNCTCHITKMAITLLYERQPTLDIMPALDAAFSLGSRLTKHSNFSGPVGHWNIQHSIRTNFPYICCKSITPFTYPILLKTPLTSR
jgi:hypothetical protein